MSTNATPALEGSGTDGRTETLTAREARALTEYMTVLNDVEEARDAPGIYRVTPSSSQRSLIVIHLTC